MNLEEQLRDLIDLAPPHIQRHFACDCAERALKMAKVRDERSWLAVEVSRRYTEGEATDEELDAAWNAAWYALSSAWYALNAARSAWYAGSAARSAGSAARSAAESAAEYAARSAWNVAWSAAGYAAGSAAEYAERQWQLAHLQSMISNHNEARSSLLFVLQQRAESIKPIFAQYAHDLEERVFE